MKKQLILFSILLAAANIFSQPYYIKFVATGAATTLDSVEVKNLKKGTSLSLKGTDDLRLVKYVGIQNQNSRQENASVYPSPMKERAELSFYAKEPGTSRITIYDISGKEVAGMSTQLSAGQQKFELKGLHEGSYVVKIIGDKYQFSLKFTCINNSQHNPVISYVGNVNPVLKTAMATIDLPYTNGDSMRYTGYSGIYMAVVKDVPISSKTITFTFSPKLPILTTTTVTGITDSSATSGGNVTDDQGFAIITRGVCWSTSANPVLTGSHTTDGSGKGVFTSNITGLLDGTLYYVRAYATNIAGTGYGNQLSFTTKSSFICGTSTVKDVDGNTYNTVLIGSQCWHRENLKTTKYINGNMIPNVTDNSSWSTLTTGAYCDYENLTNNGIIYGHLYNYFAVIDSRKLCPSGWHVPSDAEWTTLTDYLGGESIAGGKLKATDTIYWKSPNTGATNETGFTALPGGLRGNDGSFALIYSRGCFSTSTEYSPIYSRYRNLQNYLITVTSAYHNKTRGYSVRCLKD